MNRRGGQLGEINELFMLHIIFEESRLRTKSPLWWPRIFLMVQLLREYF